LFNKDQTDLFYSSSRLTGIINIAVDSLYNIVELQYRWQLAKCSVCLKLQGPGMRNDQNANEKDDAAENGEENDEDYQYEEARKAVKRDAANGKLMNLSCIFVDGIDSNTVLVIMQKWQRAMAGDINW